MFVMDMKTGAEQPLELDLDGKSVQRQEPIYVRQRRLKSLFNGVGGKGGRGRGQELEELTSDVLLDSFLVLYDEFRASNECDDFHRFFINKYAKSFAAVKNNLVNVNDFSFGGLIGQGRFGQVRVAREDRSGRVYAVKILEKSDSWVQKNIPSLDNELNILASAKSAWLAQLKYSFHSPDSLYFVMEYIPGGDFNSVVRLTDGKLSEEFTKFYMAELVLAIEAVHSFGYAHRDIRPENILFDRLGHIKLVDFGSAAKIGKDNKVIGIFNLGSPTYVAPEILQSLEDDEEKLKLEDQEGKYGPGCDFWSLGVLAYEWMFGSSPFAGSTEIQTFNNIISFETSFTIPKDTGASPDFVDLLSQLLTTEKDRIGYTKLLRHSFFQTIIWDSIRTEIPPYMPIIKSEDDLSNFQPNGKSFLPASVPIKEKLPTKAFIGFTRTMFEATPSGLNTSLNNNNSVLNSTTHWTDNSADSSFYQREDLAGPKENGVLQAKAELEAKLEIIEEKSAKIDSLESKLEILNTFNTEKDNKIASLSSQVKRLQCEKEITVKELEEERELRQTLEAKTTDLVTNIKGSQQKKISELQNEITLQRRQISDREQQLEDYHQVLTKLREENITLKSSIEHSVSVKSGEKSLRSSRQSVRQSISILESHMNLSTFQWESRIQEIEAKCSLELERQREASVKKETQFIESISRYKSELNDLIGRLEESRNSRDATLAELNQLYKDYDLLKRDSQQKLNELNYLLLTAQSEQNTKMEETFVDLESKLEQTKKERDRFSIRIDALVEETQQKELQIQSLSQAVGRLEASIASIEKYQSDFSQVMKQSQENIAGGFECAERILREQLSRAQDSLDKSNLQLCAEMQKSKEMEQKWAAIEKEFTVARMDLKILKRDKKDMDMSIERLEREKLAAQNSIKNLEEEKILIEIKVGCMEGEILDLQSKLGNSERGLTNSNEIIEHLKDNQNRINREYDELAAELFQSQEKLVDYETLRVSLEERENEMQKKEDSLNEKDRTIEQLNNNVQHLKDVVALLDSQLKDLDNIVALNNDETTKVLKAKTVLELENAKLQDELRSVNLKLKELKERKSLEARQLSDVSAALKSEESRREKEVDFLKDRVEVLKESNEDLAFRIAELEGNFEELSVIKGNLATTLETLQVENLSLKEESSRFITQIVKTKELNITYKSALEEAVNKIEVYRDALSEKTETVASIEAEKADIESRFQATYYQHRKIIELLQDMKLDKASNPAFSARKKKPLFTTRIFGRFDKEKEKDREREDQNILFERDLLNLLAELPMRSPEFKRASTAPSNVGRVLNFISPTLTPAAQCGGGDTVTSPVTPSIFSRTDCKSNGNGPVSTSTPSLSSPQIKSPAEPALSNSTPKSSKLHPIIEEEAEEEQQLIRKRDLKIHELLKLRVLQKQQQQQLQQASTETVSETDTDDPDTCKGIFLESREAPAKPAGASAVFKTTKILEINKNANAENEASIGQVYCVKEMTRDLCLIGADAGLFSRKISDVRPDKCVQIEGLDTVYQLEFILNQNLAILIEGRSRRLISVAYGMLEACAKAASCSRPEVGFGQETLANLEGVMLFRVQKKEDKVGSYVVVVLESQIVILDRLKDNFVVRNRLPTPQTVTCLLTTANSVFFAANSKVYGLSVRDYSLEEFADDSDETVSYSISGSNDSGPVAILDVGRSNLTSGQTVYTPEYLICFSDYALFMDGYGRRSRSEPITWNKVPLSVEYCHPNLYVTHFNSIEVLRLDPSSYTRARVIVNRDSIGKEVELIPESHFLPLTNPRIVGSGSGSGSNSSNNGLRNRSSSSVIVVAEDKLKEFILDVNIEVPMELYSDNSSIFEISSSSGRSALSNSSDGESQSQPTASDNAIVSDSNETDGDSSSTTATDFSGELLAFDRRAKKGFMGRLPIFMGICNNAQDLTPGPPKPNGHGRRAGPGAGYGIGTLLSNTTPTNTKVDNWKPQVPPKNVNGSANGKFRSPQKPQRIRFAEPTDDEDEYSLSN